jgi:hypothetical protein
VIWAKGLSDLMRGGDVALLPGGCEAAPVAALPEAGYGQATAMAGRFRLRLLAFDG